MTDGTSQGLFIVVAIVIFGIFTVLAYILFEDTLSPAMASMFTNAVEQSKTRLVSNNNLISTDILHSYTLYHDDYKKLGETSFSVTRTGNTGILAMYVLPENEPEINETYTLSGYMFLDGKPVKDSMWRTRGFSNRHNSVSFYVDDTTGYFESTMTLDVVGTSQWFRQLILHAAILNEDGSYKEGEVIEVRDLKLIKVTK